jgi:hypothetical protein
MEEKMEDDRMTKLTIFGRDNTATKIYEGEVETWKQAKTILKKHKKKRGHYWLDESVLR